MVSTSTTELQLNHHKLQDDNLIMAQTRDMSHITTLGQNLLSCPQPLKKTNAYWHTAELIVVTSDLTQNTTSCKVWVSFSFFPRSACGCTVPPRLHYWVVPNQTFHKAWAPFQTSLLSISPVTCLDATHGSTKTQLPRCKSSCLTYNASTKPNHHLSPQSHHPSKGLQDL